MTAETERYPHELRVSFLDGKPVKAIIEGVEFRPSPTQSTLLTEDVVEAAAMALIEPLGYSPTVDWERTWIGNQCDSVETGSLAYLCRGLARAALAACRYAELSRSLRDG